jgi:hypothetical protein
VHAMETIARMPEAYENYKKVRTLIRRLQRLWVNDLVVRCDRAIAQSVVVSTKTAADTSANENGLYDSCDLQRFAPSATWTGNFFRSGTHV